MQWTSFQLGWLFCPPNTCTINAFLSWYFSYSRWLTLNSWQRGASVLLPLKYNRTSSAVVVHPSDMHYLCLHFACAEPHTYHKQMLLCNSAISVLCVQVVNDWGKWSVFTLYTVIFMRPPPRAHLLLTFSSLSQSVQVAIHNETALYFERNQCKYL